MLKKIYYSLPFQLLLINIKRNQSIFIFWILLIAIVTSNFAKRFGVPYLFLDPEYLNSVDFKSMYILGFAFGIFTMAYNITLYILESYRFHFLVIGSNPFGRFCINNALLPTIFLFFYFPNFIHFQLKNGFQGYRDICLEIIGFFIGFVTTVLITFLYFKITGRALFKNLTFNVEEQLRGYKLTRVNIINKIKVVKKKRYYTDWYIDFPFKIRRVNQFVPIEKMQLTRLFDINHLNAILLEILGLFILIMLGYFRDYDVFQIPAGASILLFFSIIIMFLGAFNYWLKGWSVYVIISMFVIFNYMIKHEWVNPDYEAFGLNYDGIPSEYSKERIYALNNSDYFDQDWKQTIRMLDNWKNKFGRNSRPKAVLICTSGGGQRAAVWAIKTLQTADSIVGGNLMKNTVTITGASGGLIGAAYYRELYLRSLTNPKIKPTDRKYLENISKDILNPVVFSLIVNDLFLRFQYFNDGKHKYIKDRGYSFEHRLTTNTEGILNKKVTDYQEDEQKGKIPMMMITPSVVNDGRKLYISAQPVSYMNSARLNELSKLGCKTNGIEFMRFFKEQDAANLYFLSALRMSATFPYITPNINLPSKPGMEIMDAGVTDNYGIVEAVKFLFIFREWFKNNTSGVVLMCIRDSPKEFPIEKFSKNTFLQKIFNPIGSLYNNWDYLQDAHNDYYLEFANDFMHNKLEVVDFQYVPADYDADDVPFASQMNRNDIKRLNKDQRASLSWHLTAREKLSINNTMYVDINQQELKRFEQLLK